MVCVDLDQPRRSASPPSLSGRRLMAGLSPNAGAIHAHPGQGQAGSEGLRDIAIGHSLACRGKGCFLRDEEAACQPTRLFLLHPVPFSSPGDQWSLGFMFEHHVGQFMAEAADHSSRGLSRVEKNDPPVVVYVDRHRGDLAPSDSHCQMANGMMVGPRHRRTRAPGCRGAEQAVVGRSGRQLRDRVRHALHGRAVQPPSSEPHGHRAAREAGAAHPAHRGANERDVRLPGS
jgi:hypothetical protein